MLLIRAVHRPQKPIKYTKFIYGVWVLWFRAMLLERIAMKALIEA